MSTSPRGTRGMTLLEALLVVALVGIFAALATPSMVKRMNQAYVDVAAESVASLVDAARAEAMASKRCARLFPIRGGLALERLNSFDCDTAPQTAPRIDGRPISPATTWTRIKDEAVQGDVALLTPPALTNPPGNGGVGPELRLRPTGRVWGQDLDLHNDDVVLEVTSPRAPGVVRRILVEGNGLLCVLPRNTEPPADARGGFTCAGVSPR